MNTDKMKAEIHDPERNSGLHAIPTDLLSNVLFQKSPDLICTVGADGYFAELNLSWEETLGFTLEELKSKPFFEFLHPDDLESTKKEFTEQLEGKDTFGFVNRYRHKDGSYRWFDWRGKATPDKSMAFAVARDITEERRTRELLLQSEQKYRLLFQNLDDGWAFFDVVVNDAGEATDLYFLEFNKAFLDLTHTMADELTGKMFSQVFPDVDKVRTIRYGNVSLTGIPCTEEFYSQVFQRYIRIHVYSPQLRQVVVMVEDITQRSISEEQLRLSETKFRTLTENSGDIIMRIDPDYHCLYANPIAINFIGLKPEDRSGHYQLINESETELGFWIDRLRKVFESGEQLREITTIRKNGDWYDWSLIPETGADGKMMSALIVARNITSLIRAEEEIRLSEQRFRRAFNMPGIGIAMTSLTKGWIEINPALAEMLGYTMEEIKAKTWEEMTHPDDLGADLAQFNRVLAGEIDNYSLEKRFICKSGEVIWTIMSAGCIRQADQSVDYFVAMIMDITQRKQAQEELRQGRILLRTLIDTLPYPIYVKDHEGRKLISNTADWQLIGKDSEAEILGKTDLELYESMEIGMRGYQDDTSVLKTGRPIVQEEAFISKSGDEVVLSTTKVPLADENGKIIGLVGVGHDITDRKKAEVLLRRQALELRESIAEKDKFFSILAHDLRSPFNGFLGLIQTLEDDYMTLSITKLQSYLSALGSSARNLFRLLENLLEWSQMKRGVIPFNPVSFLLKPEADSSIESLMTLVQQKEMTITNEIPETLLAVADVPMVAGIFRNLISNAVKFTPRGGKIFVSAQCPAEGMVEVTVSDNGIGIPAGMQANLFRVGAEVQRKGTEREPSSGLGLILCQEFVEKNGGTIRVESEEGKGSRFSFTLPCLQVSGTGNMGVPVMDAAETSTQDRRMKILVAEDEMISRMFLVQMLIREGHAVLSAEDGHETVRQCVANPDLDLVLMDINMPGIDGLAAVKEIRRFNQKVPIVIQSARDIPGIRQEAAEAGCNEFIAKPIQMAMLRQLISKYLK